MSTTHSCKFRKTLISVILLYIVFVYILENPGNWLYNLVIDLEREIVQIDYAYVSRIKLIKIGQYAGCAPCKHYKCWCRNKPLA